MRKFILQSYLDLFNSPAQRCLTHPPWGVQFRRPYCPIRPAVFSCQFQAAVFKRQSPSRHSFQSACGTARLPTRLLPTPLWTDSLPALSGSSSAVRPCGTILQNYTPLMTRPTDRAILQKTIQRHYAKPAVIAGRMSCDIWPDQMRTLAGCRRIRNNGKSRLRIAAAAE